MKTNNQIIGIKTPRQLTLEQLENVIPLLIGPYIELETKLTSDSPVKILIEDIVDYNIEVSITDSENHISFYNFLEKKSKKKYDHSNDKNYIRVTKLRANNILKELDLHITKDFLIQSSGEHSMLEIFYRGRKLFDTIRANKRIIKRIKLFDFYHGKSREKILNKERIDTIIREAKVNECKFEIITAVESEESHKFYKELLRKSETIKKDNGKPLEIKVVYTRKPFYHISNIIYVLIEDNQNQNYVIYFEETIKWGVCTEINNANFSKDFYKILNMRFNNIFSRKTVYNEQKKDTSHEILDLNFNRLNTKKKETLINEVFELINELKYFILTLSYDSKDFNIYKNVKINEFIKRIKLLKLKYPKMEKSNQLLFHYVKLVDVFLTCNKDTKNFQVTHSIIEILNMFDLISVLKDLSFKSFKNELVQVSKDIKLETNIKELIHIKPLYKCKNMKLTLSSLFPNLHWNNNNTIICSINSIINDLELQTILLKCYSPIDSKIILATFREFLTLFSVQERMIFSNYILSKILKFKFNNNLIEILNSKIFSDMNKNDLKRKRNDLNNFLKHEIFDEIREKIVIEFDDIENVLKNNLEKPLKISNYKTI